MRAVHVIPSGDVATVVDVCATAQNNPNSGDQQTDSQNADDGSVRAVQFIPSGEVAATVEAVPVVAQNSPSSGDQHTDFQLADDGSVRAVQAPTNVLALLTVE